MSKQQIEKTRYSGRDPLLGTFATTRRNPQRAVVQLKTQRTYRQAKKIMARLRAFRLETIYHGNLVVKDWDDILSSPLHKKSFDWVQEFGWLTHGFCLHASPLNDFLVQRKAFGKAYLLGQYALAEDILDEIEAQHGYSFWLAERRFMVLELSKGFDSHKEYLAKLQSEIPAPLAAYIITMLSNRVETHVGFQAFLTSVEKVLDQGEQLGREDLAALIEVQVAPWTKRWITQAPSLLWWCSGRPLIDRYDRAIKIAAYLSYQTSTDDQKHEIALILDDLRSAVNDRQLLQLQASIVSNSELISYDENTELYLRALDLFVLGRYQECAKATEDLVLKDPTSFDFYRLLAQAVACCSDPFVISLHERSLSHIIFEALREVIENRSDQYLPVISLLSLSLKLGDNNLGLSLWQFAQHRYEIGSTMGEACRFAAVQSKVNLPDPFMDADRDRQIQRAEEMQRVYSGHISLDFILYRNGGGVNDAFLSQIAPGLVCLANAENAVFYGKPLDVLGYLEPIFSNTENSAEERRFQAQQAVSLRFDAFLESQQPEKAADEILRYYITDQNLLHCIPLERLISGVNSGKWEALRSSPHWPILVLLHGEQSKDVNQDVYEAVDDFLVANRFTSPLQLLNEDFLCSPEALRVLLRDVLTLEVLSRGALWIEEQEQGKEQQQIRDLRIRLLEKLASISDEDEDFIAEEIVRIKQAQILEDAFQNVEGPKFFLEFGELNKDFEQVLEGLYHRFRSFKEYEDKGGQLADEADLFEMAAANSVRALEEKGSEERKTETSDILLRNIVVIIFANYLFHPHKGINATLRTRIIHGALENQLKRVFGSHHLLTIKDSEGNYQLSEVVLDKILICSEVEIKAVEEAYTKLTQCITDIHSLLVSEKLRIQLPESVIVQLEKDGFPVTALVSREGLLDFSNLFDNAFLSRLADSEQKGVTELITELHISFVAQAKESFHAVQQFIKTEVSIQVDAALNTADDAIVEALNDGSARAALREDIIAARNEFASDILAIQQWFAATLRSSTSFKSLSEVIQTGARIVNFSTNDKLGVLVEGDFCDEQLLSELGFTLYEVVSILLRNIVQHSDLPSGQRVEYHHEVGAQGRRILTVTNMMRDNESCANAIRGARLSLSKPRDARVLDRSPGGTGLARIRALLTPHCLTPVDIKVEQQISDERRFAASITYQLLSSSSSS